MNTTPLFNDLAIEEIIKSVMRLAIHDYIILRASNLITPDDRVNCSAWPRRRDGHYKLVLENCYTPAECVKLILFLRQMNILSNARYLYNKAIQQGPIRGAKWYPNKPRRVTLWLSKSHLPWLKAEAARLNGRIVRKRLAKGIRYAVEV